MARVALAEWMAASAYRWYRHRNVRRREEVDILMRWLDPRPGETILDIGCGDGMYTYEVARSDATVVGIDIDRRRLSVARRWHTTPGTQYHAMDADRLAFRDQVFDKAVSFCVIEHLQRGMDVLDQVRRVLKPDAPLVFSADSLSSPELTTVERRAHQHRYAVQTFYDLTCLRRTLADAGFRLEVARYILTAPLTLHLVRLSWWLDRLPSVWRWVSHSGYLALGTVGSRVVGLAERATPRHDSGLTLLALARKA